MLYLIIHVSFLNYYFLLKLDSNFLINNVKLSKYFFHDYRISLNKIVINHDIILQNYFILHLQTKEYIFYSQYYSIKNLLGINYSIY